MFIWQCLLPISLPAWNSIVVAFYALCHGWDLDSCAAFSQPPHISRDWTNYPSHPTEPWAWHGISLAHSLPVFVCVPACLKCGPYALYVFTAMPASISLLSSLAHLPVPFSPAFALSLLPSLLPYLLLFALFTLFSSFPPPCMYLAMNSVGFGTDRDRRHGATGRHCRCWWRGTTSIYLFV